MDCEPAEETVFDQNFVKKITSTKIGKKILYLKTIRFLLEFCWVVGKSHPFPMAAQMAYYFLFSILPLVIILVTLISHFSFSDGQLIAFIEKFAPDDVDVLIQHIVTMVQTSPSIGMLSVGFLIAMWSASSGMNSILFTLNRAYDVSDNLTYFKRKAHSIFLTVLMLTTLLLALIFFVFGKVFISGIIEILHLQETIPILVYYFTWFISISILFLMFLVLYWVGPAYKVRLRDAIPGTIFASFGWVLSSLAFAFYIDNIKDYSVIYGAISGIIVLMLWFYITGLLLLIGGELNAFIQKKRDAVTR